MESNDQTTGLAGAASGAAVVRLGKPDLAVLAERNDGPAFARYGWPLLIIAVIWIVYWPGFRNEFLNWDDEKLLVTNTSYRGFGWTELKWIFTTIHMGHYQPLVWLSYALDWTIWGLDAAGFFLTNLLIHSATALCFYFLSCRLIRLAIACSPQDARRAATIAALLFAVHPLRVESVVWLSERRDVLSGLFCLLTVYCYTRSAEGSLPANRRWYGAALLAYAASLLSKATAVGLPLVLLLLDWYPIRRCGTEAGRSRTAVVTRLLLNKAPFALLAGIITLVALYAQRHSHTVAPLVAHGIGARLLIAAYGLFFYLERSFLPWGLSPLVPMPSRVEPFTIRLGGSAILVLAAAGLVYIARRRWPAGAVTACAYFLLLLPVMGLVQIGPQMVADRYSYLPCLGFAMLLGGTTIAMRHAPSSRKRLAAVVLRGVLCLGIAVIGILTRSQIAVWRNSTTLWSRVLERHPDSGIAHEGLAVTLAEQGRVTEAIRHMKRAAELNPSWSQPHSDLGGVLLLQGDYAGATRSLEQAVALMPDRFESWNDLGAAYLQLDQLEPARRAFEHAITLQPSFAMGHYNLAQLLSRLQDYQGALEHLHLAVQAVPDSLPFREGLAWFLATCPEDSLRDGSRALSIAEQICQQAPDPAPTALDVLAAAYAEVGHYEAAIRTAERARDAARRSGQAGLADDIETRLERYNAHRTYRMPGY